MNLYGLLRMFLPGMLANVIYTLICTLTLLLAYMFWPIEPRLFAYIKL